MGDGTTDALIGVVQTRELLAAILAGKTFEVRSHIRKAPIVPETMYALDVLSVLRGADARVEVSETVVSPLVSIRSRVPCVYDGC